MTTKSSEANAESMKTTAVIIMRDASDIRVEKAAWAVDPYGNLNVVDENDNPAVTVPEGEWLAVVCWKWYGRTARNEA